MSSSSLSIALVSDIQAQHPKEGVLADILGHDGTGVWRVVSKGDEEQEGAAVTTDTQGRELIQVAYTAT